MNYHTACSNAKTIKISRRPLSFKKDSSLLATRMHRQHAQIVQFAWSQPFSNFRLQGAFLKGVTQFERCQRGFMQLI